MAQRATARAKARAERQRQRKQHNPALHPVLMPSQLLARSVAHGTSSTVLFVHTSSYVHSIGTYHYTLDWRSPTVLEYSIKGSNA